MPRAWPPPCTQQHTAVTQITSTVEELAQQAHYIAEAAGAVDSTSEAALVTREPRPASRRGQRGGHGRLGAQCARDERAHDARWKARSRLIHRTLQTINNIAERDAPAGAQRDD